MCGNSSGFIGGGDGQGSAKKTRTSRVQVDDQDTRSEAAEWGGEKNVEDFAFFEDREQLVIANKREVQVFVRGHRG